MAIKFLLASGLGALAFALAGLADSTLAPADNAVISKSAGEAIYGTRIVAPYSTTDVDYTRSKDGKTVYAIVKNPSAEVTLRCALPAEAQVTELVSGRELAVVRDGTTVRVRLPADLVSAKLPFVLKMSAFDMRK